MSSNNIFLVSIINIFLIHEKFYSPCYDFEVTVFSRNKVPQKKVETKCSHNVLVWCKETMHSSLQ